MFFYIYFCPLAYGTVIVIVNGKEQNAGKETKTTEKMVCPNYTGEKYYKQEPAVTDGNLITASGIAPLEFAVHVLKALDVFSTKTLDAWYNLYKTQASKYFFELMNSIQS